MELIKQLRMEASRSVGELRDTLNQAIETIEAAEQARVYAKDLLAGFFNKLLHSPTIDVTGDTLLQMHRLIKTEIQKVPVLHERPAEDGGPCANAAHDAWVADVTDFLELCHYVPGYMRRPVASETATRLFGGRK